MRRLGLALLLALACAACSPQPPQLLVLISLDTLRPDHLGCYGYDRPTSPALDAFAAQGVLFEDVTTPSPWTLPAHASLLTGLYPARHGVKGDVSLPPEVDTLAALLSERGWETAAVVNSHLLTPQRGFDRGFDDFVYIRESVRQRAPSTLVTNQAIAWLERERERPLFLFLHYYDAHSDYRSLDRYEEAFTRPYDGDANGTTAQLVSVRRGDRSFDERDLGRVLDLYDAGIRQLDEELERLLDFLAESGRAAGTLVAVTSDHGEEFLEHGSVLHGRAHFEEVVRVPLLLRGPGLPAGRRVETPVSLVDVMPTLLSLAGVTAPADLDGADLAPLWSGGGVELAERVLFVEADWLNQEFDIKRAVREGRFKLHVNHLSGESALYDLVADPAERVDRSDDHPEVATRLRERLAVYEAAGTTRAPRYQPSEEERQTLRALGYLD